MNVRPGGLLRRLRILSERRFLVMLERIGDSFPGSIAIDNGVLNYLAAPLQVAVSHRGVKVERSILDVVIQFHVVRAFVNPLRGGAPKVGTDRRYEPRQRVHE